MWHIIQCVVVHSVFSSAVSVSVQCTQRWASIGTALAALTASENDIVKASGVTQASTTHVCLLGSHRVIASLTTVLSLTTCHCGGDKLAYLLKTVFKQASLPLSHSHHPSGAIGYTLSQCLLYWQASLLLALLIWSFSSAWQVYYN